MICPKCKTKSEYDFPIFCHTCGTYLHNECSNEECDLNDEDCKDKPIQINDKYCYLCGNETTFNNKKYSEIVICPKCKTKIHYDEPLYCHECGAYLVNYCSNSDCDLNNGQYDDEQCSLKHDDKFCYLCGHETTFKTNGYFDNEK